MEMGARYCLFLSIFHWFIFILFCFQIPDRLVMDSAEIISGGGEQCHPWQAVEQQLLPAT